MDKINLPPIPPEILAKYGKPHLIQPILTPEERFRQKVREDVQARLKAFTFEEHMRIAFTPHVIIDTIWFYVDQVQGYCREHQISDMKKVSRAINHLRTEYRNELLKDLPQKHLDQIHQKSVEWRQMCANTITITFFTMSNTLLKEYKSQDYLQCMNNAYVAMKLIGLAKSYNKEVNELIRKRMGQSDDAPAHPILDKLYACMDAHLPDKFKVDDTQIDLCMKVFRNNLNLLKYESND